MATSTKKRNGNGNGSRSAQTEQTLVEQFVASAEARLAELEPMVTEADELRTTLARVKGETKAPAPRSTPARSTGTKQKRNRKGGRRADQFVAVVKENPGMGVSEIAKKMGIKPNYVYRLAKEVVEEGQVRKDGSTYVAA